MLGWLRRRRATEPAPLTGAPEVRRMKTYSGSSGYVYQYVYEGHRPAGQATEYVFAVSADRREYFPAPVLLQHEAVDGWEQAHGRTLSATERYGLAKMALRQAFDERANPAEMRRPVLVRRADIDPLAEALNLE